MRLLEVAHDALEEVQSLLSVDRVDVVLCDNPSWAIPGIGVGGFSASAHLVQISFDPGVADFAGHVGRELPPTIAHEMHHAKRWRNPGYGQTLLEAMVTEGLAQCFEVPFRNGELPEYAKAIEPEEIADLMARARLEFDNPTYNHQDWFFGNQARAIPIWAGYTLGFRMVRKYLEKTGESAASAHAVTAKTVLETLEA